MQKMSFKISNLKLDNVYGLPTIPGLILSGILAFSLWCSIFNNSDTERWIFIFMLFMFVINLLDTSFSFRMIEIKVLPIDPPFCDETTKLNLEIMNPSNVRSGSLWVRLIGMNKWIEVNGVEANSSQIISIRTSFPKPGLQIIPVIRIKTYADSGLYRFWRNINSKMNIIVLPKAVDHKISASSNQSITEDHELIGFEEIRDPSRFMFADPKLFQKTNRKYQRIFQSRRASTQISYRWSDLENLSRQQKGEQFSFWLKSLTFLQYKQSVDVSVDAPFVQLQSQADLIDLVSLKSNFAKWFYVEV